MTLPAEFHSETEALEGLFDDNLVGADDAPVASPYQEINDRRARLESPEGLRLARSL